MKGHFRIQMKRLAHLAIIYSLLLQPSAFSQQQTSGLGGIASLISSASQLATTVLLGNQAPQNAQGTGVDVSQFKPQAIPADFFPQCKMLPARAARIKGVCEDQTENNEGYAYTSQDHDQAQSFSVLAEEWEEFYDQLLLDGPAKQGVDRGLQCISEQLTQLENQINHQAQNIENLIQQANVSFEKTRDLQKALMEEMMAVKRELEGPGEGTKDENQNIKLPASIHIANGSCAATFPNSIHDRNGLYAFRQSADQKHENAVAISTQLDGAIKSINDYKTKLKSNFAKYGAESLKEGGINSADVTATTSMISLPAVSTQTNLAYKKFEADLAKATADFSEFMDPNEINFSRLSRKDSNFKNHLQNMRKDLDQHFRKSTINKCVFDASYGINPSELVSRIKQITGGEIINGTSVIDYRNSVESILKNDSLDIQQKIARVAALDKQFRGEMKIDFKKELFGKSRGYQWTASELLTYSVENCNRVYQSSTSGAKNFNKSQSHKEKLEGALAILDQIEKSHDNILNSTISNIDKNIINCPNISAPLAANCSNDSNWRPESGNFCVARTVACTQATKSCMAIVEKEIEARVQIRNRLTIQYNANVDSYIQVQRGFLDRYKKDIVAQMQFLNSYFPTAKYEIPQDLLIESPPKLVQGDTGVKVVGGNELEQLNQLPQKLGIIKKGLIDQMKKVTDAVNKKKQDLASQYRKELAYWKGFKDDCDSIVKGYNSQVVEQNKAIAQQEQELQEGTGEFCNNLNSFSFGPGCSEKVDQLQADVANVAQGINPEAVNHRLNQYREICAQFNNQEEPGSEEPVEKDNSKSDLAQQLANALEKSKEEEKPTETPLQKLCSSKIDGEGVIKHYEKFQELEINSRDPSSEFSDPKMQSFLTDFDDNLSTLKSANEKIEGKNICNELDKKLEEVKKEVSAENGLCNKDGKIDDDCIVEEQFKKAKSLEGDLKKASSAVTQLDDLKKFLPELLSSDSEKIEELKQNYQISKMIGEVQGSQIPCQAQVGGQRSSGDGVFGDINGLLQQFDSQYKSGAGVQN